MSYCLDVSCSSWCNVRWQYSFIVLRDLSDEHLLLRLWGHLTNVPLHFIPSTQTKLHLFNTCVLFHLASLCSCPTSHYTMWKGPPTSRLTREQLGSSLTGNKWKQKKMHFQLHASSWLWCQLSCESHAHIVLAGLWDRTNFDSTSIRNSYLLVSVPMPAPMYVWIIVLVPIHSFCIVRFLFPFSLLYSEAIVLIPTFA